MTFLKNSLTGLERTSEFNISDPLLVSALEGNATLNRYQEVGITEIDSGLNVTDTPKRAVARYPERLLQLFAALRRECFSKMQSDPPYNSGRCHVM